jgi:probable F420-dependent oxidoreductase
VDLGVIVFPTDYGVEVRDLARLVEGAGFESMFFPEHTHVPVDRTSQFPAGGDLPEPYHRNIDPFVAHAVAATVTERLRLGTGICLVAQREPIALAKTIASLDFVSDGRFILGVGAGWNVEEMRNHGVDPARRWAVVRDHVLAMKAIWVADEAEFAGEFTSFPPLWSWPKPVQRPNPPVLVGGMTPRAWDRVLAIGDGWIPALDVEKPIEGMLDAVAAFRRHCEEKGAVPPPVTLAMGYGRTSTADELRLLEAAAVERVLLWLPTLGYAETAAFLAKLAQLGGPAGR